VVSGRLAAALAASLVVSGAPPPAGAQAGSALLAEVSPPAQELGLPFRLVLRAVASPVPLHRIDLAPLQADFGVRQRDVGREPGGTVEVLRLDLYPRAVGPLTVPSLSLGALESAPVRVEVSPAREGEQVITVETQVSRSDPWVGQTLWLGVTLHSPESEFRLEPESVPRGFQGLDPGGLPARGATAGRAWRRFAWRFVPAQAGDHALPWPALRYQGRGRVRRFELRPTALSVRPLPPYLPPTAPVGRVRFGSRLEPARWLRTGRLATWQVTIEGEGLPAEVLQGLLPTVDWGATAQGWPVEWTVETPAGAAGPAARVRAAVPFTPRRAGRLSLPALRVHFLDPETGRVELAEHQPGSVWLLSPAWVAGLGLAPAGLAAGVAVRPVRRLGRWRRARRARHAALTALARAGRPEEVRAALGDLGVAAGLGPLSTLGRWGAAWEGQHPPEPALRGALETLGQALYSGAPADLEAVKSRLLSALTAPGRARRGRRFRGVRPPAPAIRGG
jgi:hypothetical protein